MCVTLSAADPSGAGALRFKVAQTYRVLKFVVVVSEWFPTYLTGGSTLRDVGVIRLVTVGSPDVLS
jgi:hypothetical protein